MHAMLKRIVRRLAEETDYAACLMEHRVSPFRDLRIVTGANAPYAKVLLRLMRTLREYEKDTPVSVFDLGLTEKQRDAVQCSHSCVELHRFDFTVEPPWFDINVNAGFWAWKPVIINRIYQEAKQDVLWLDASVIVREPMLRIRREIRRHGLYSPRWQGVATRTFTHPDTVARLNGDAFVDDDMLIAAVIGLSNTHPSVRKLVAEWASCARIKECIAPVGASPSTHKGDQSILSILAKQNGFSDAGSRECLGLFVDNIRKNWAALLDV